jgi:hypothetical protein
MNHEIEASIELRTAAESRVLVAQGGAMGGFSVYLKDGVPVYCYNWFGAEHTYVRGPQALGPGRHVLRVKVMRKPDNSAEVSLMVDDQSVAQAVVPRLTPRLYEASDGFSVGVDQGSSVAPEAAGIEARSVESLRFRFEVRSGAAQ